MKAVKIKWIFWLLAITLFGNVVAAPCSEERARTVAYHFCLGNGIQFQDGITSLTMVDAGAGFDGFYIFNLPKKEGWVIVSSDDCLYPILGYSFEGTFSTQNANAMSWLRGCQRLVQQARVDGGEPIREVSEECGRLEDGDVSPMDGSGMSVPPLMTTTWNQGEFYNDSCPYVATEHTNALTGCVATAMAQVMNYWKRPTVGQGSHGYTHSTLGYQYANFGTTYYDWSHMTDALNEWSSPLERRAQAQLVYHCGVAVEMGYGAGGSSAFVTNYGNNTSPCTENALRTYFRYKSSLRSIFEDNMSSAAWLDSIKQELLMGRPVPYAGYQGGGGHAFVIDGVDAYNRVHVNWGWGGMCDGYYALTPLPAYSMGCQALVGVQPIGILYSSRRTVAYSQTGGVDSLVIFPNENNTSGWIAYSNRDWLSVTPTAGTGTAVVAIHADSNNTGQNRSGNVIVRQGTDSIFIAVIQYGYTGIDQVFPSDDTIYMDTVVLGDVPTDTIYPGVHYVIYSPGGPQGYPSPVNTKLHLVAANRANIIMDVDYDIEEGNDWLRIYDWEGEDIQLTNWTGYDTAQHIVCYSGHSFITFHADGYNPGTGIVIHLYVCDTFEVEVRNIISVPIGNDAIELRWIDTSDADRWLIKWGADFRNLDHRLEVTHPYATFTGLDLDYSNYYFRVWNNRNSDTNDLCSTKLVGAFGNGGVNCPGSLIRDFEFTELLTHSVTIRWRDGSVPGNTPLQWHVRYGTDRFNLTDSAFTDTCMITLTGLQNGTRYFFRVYNNALSNDSASICFLAQLCDFETLLCLYDSLDIRDVTVVNPTQTGVDITWQDFGNATQWRVDVRLRDSTMSITTDTPFVHVDGLQRQHSYDFIVYNNTSQNDTMRCQRWYTLQTLCDETLEPCINFTDFTSCLTQPWTGYYDNPRIWLGAHDYGEDNPHSRHTVIYTQGVDTNTGGLLMIPPDEIASVRLGNARADREAESISYLYYVDTTNYDLLLFKYAAVLDNPGHDATEQPRLTMRIMNADGSEIDDSCFYFDFISDSSLGWNTYGHVLWKDWTTVGVDLTPLHGRRIIVELTTRDCNQGGHYGYAYYSLRCGKKEIISELCGNTMYNVFHAPVGFAYRWFNQANPIVTLSTTSTLTVDTAGVFICRMSPLGNNGHCYLDMRCYSGYRFPFSVASYEYSDTVDDCRQRMVFHNQSYVTNDEQHTNPTGETITNIKWLFPDGSQSQELNPTIVLDTGIYHIRLVTYLSNGSCTDTLDILLPVTPVCPVLDTVYQNICEGDTISFFDRPLSESGVYDYRDGMYWHTMVLTVLPTTYSTFYDTIVENQIPYTFLDRTLTEPVNGMTFIVANANGCDSVIDYHLTVWYNVRNYVDTTICPEKMPLQWNGYSLYDGDTITAVLHTVHGADSVVRIAAHEFTDLAADMWVNPQVVTFDNYKEVSLINRSYGACSVTWYLGDGTVSTQPNWIYCYPIPTDSVSVLLVAESAAGCHDAISSMIRFQPTAIYAPNAITPDENSATDPHHDVNGCFRLVCVGILNLHVDIYDRRGLLIHSWDGEDGFWDGHYKGHTAPEGVYVWIAKFNYSDSPNTPQVKKGTVLLLR